MGPYQFGIDVIVDWVCWMWEVKRGVSFRHVIHFNGFLTALFSSCALTSISISAVLYVRGF